MRQLPAFSSQILFLCGSIGWFSTQCFHGCFPGFLANSFAHFPARFLPRSAAAAAAAAVAAVGTAVERQSVDKVVGALVVIPPCNTYKA